MKRPRVIGVEDIANEDPRADGPVLVTRDRAIREGGKLDVADYSVMATTAHGEGAVTLSPADLLELARAGSHLYDELQEVARRRMKQRHARYIRMLRLDNHSWRSIARLCYQRGWDWASWGPPNNQVAGMVLCERAAELHGENYQEKPWN